MYTFNLLEKMEQEEVYSFHLAKKKEHKYEFNVIPSFFREIADKTGEALLSDLSDTGYFWKIWLVHNDAKYVAYFNDKELKKFFPERIGGKVGDLDA